MDIEELQIAAPPKKRGSPLKKLGGTKKLTAEQIEERRAAASAKLVDAARLGKCGDMHWLLGSATLSAAERKDRQKRGEVDAEINVLVAPENLRADWARTALVEAVFHNQPDAVQLLLDSKADPTMSDGSTWTPLIAAAEQGLLPIMRQLLRAGADLDSSWLDAVDEDIGCTAFQYAGIMGHRDCTAALRRAGCSTEIQSRDGVEGLELAKLVCARAGRRGRTNVLARKAKEEKENSLEEVVKVDRDVLYMDEQGKWQAGEKKELGYDENLHAAAITGDLPMLQRLLMVADEKGIDINDFDQHGQTPLYLAVCSGQLKMAQILLINHANPYIKGTNGSAPIHGAARHGQTDCVEMLLERKADVNVSGVHGRTPLILAASSGHVNTVRALLQHGADPHQVDNDSRSAVDLAANLHIIHLLRRALEKRALRHGRYEVAEHSGRPDDTSTELGNCAGVCEGTKAIDTITGEHVVLLRFQDDLACERMRTAMRALHGTFAGGFGAINHTPPPWVPPSEVAEEKPTEVEPTLALSSTEEEDNGDDDGDHVDHDDSSDTKDDPVPEDDQEQEHQGRNGDKKQPPPQEDEETPDSGSGPGGVIVVQAWSSTLGEYFYSAHNVMPLVEVRAVLRSLLYALSALHAASLAHGAIGLDTVARHWDGSWRLIDLHRVRHQGIESDPDLISQAESEANAQAAAADDRDSSDGTGRGDTQHANFSSLLARERERNNGGPVIPLRLPSIPPEGVRRARAEADIWAVGVLALGLLTRTGRRHSLPCGRAATPEAYWEALNEWMHPSDEQHGDRNRIALSPDAEELVEGLVSYDPSGRLSADEALDLPFFAQAHTVPKEHDYDRIQQLGGEPGVPARVPTQVPKEFQRVQKQDSAGGGDGMRDDDTRHGEEEQLQQQGSAADSVDGGADEEALAEEQAWREQLESVRVLVAQRSRAKTIRRKRKILLRDDADSFGELRFEGETDSDDDGGGRSDNVILGMGLLGAQAKTKHFKQRPAQQSDSSSEESSDDNDEPLPEESDEDTDDDEDDEDDDDDDDQDSEVIDGDGSDRAGKRNDAVSAAADLAAAVDGDGKNDGSDEANGNVDNGNVQTRKGTGWFRNLLPGKIPPVSAVGIPGIRRGKDKFSYTDEELNNDTVKHLWIAKPRKPKAKQSKFDSEAEAYDYYDYYSDSESDADSEFEIAFNDQMLQKVLARRMEREAVARYASMAGYTREQMLEWLKRKHVRWITKLPDDQREALIDELRRGVDRRWQYKENKYGAPLSPVTQLHRTALRLGKLHAMSEKLRIATPRLFCVLPSRTATTLDSVAPRWLDPKKWNSGSFALHPMCEWDGGHFLPSRYAYPIPDPQRVLRDCGAILHYNLELVQAALEAVENSPIATSSNFVVPYAKIRKEGEALRNTRSSVSGKGKGAEGRDASNSSPSSRRPIRDADEATHTSNNHPFLFRFMSEVIEKAKKRALAGSAASEEAARAAANYGTSLCHLERFVLASDPIGEFGGLYLCEPPSEKHPDRPAAAPPHRCWLCPHHAKELSNAGGSVSLGRTPPWTAGGLLYSLANQPYVAPTQPFAPPEIIAMTMDSTEPPGLSYSDDGPKGMSDRAAARKKLRKLPLPRKAPPELLPSVAAVALEVQKVEEAVALLREDKPGHAIVVIYVSPLGVQRATVGAMCTARIEKRYQPSAVVVLPDFPRDVKGEIDINRLDPPSPSDWLRSAAKKQRGGGSGDDDDDAPPDAAAVLKGLGDPKAYAEKEAKPPAASSACVLQ